MPRYLLRLRKTSFFLIHHSSAISVGSNKASSKTEAIWHSAPPWKSLMDALSLKGSPLVIGAGSQAWDSGGWLCPLSRPFCHVWLVFCCFAAHWVSSSCTGRDLPASTTSLPFSSLFLFRSANSGLDGKDGWKGGRGDLEGGGGSLGWMDFPGASFSG